MALIPQCRASEQETQTRTTLVLQSRVETETTTLLRRIHQKSLFQK